MQINPLCRRLLAVKTRLPLRFTLMVCLLMLAITAICCRTAPVAEDVTATQLKAYVYGPQGYYSTMFRGVRYVGSDAHFDYIALMYADSVARANSLTIVLANSVSSLT